jgi:hypothetical protein
MTTAQALDATAFQDTADELHRTARWHKQQANAHRRRAQETMQALDRLRVTCARLGVPLVIRSQPTGGTEPHARRTTP